MTLYAIGTVALWIGVILLVLGMGRWLRGRFQPALSDPGWLFTTLTGVALMTVGILTTRPQKPQSAIDLPLAWPVMPFWYWIGLLCVGFAIARGLQAFGALTAEERQSKLKSAGVWALVGIAAYGMVRLTNDVRFELLRGWIPLTPAVLVLFAILAIGSVIVMASVGKSAVAQGKATAVATHSALLAGTVVFGLPFAFLVITSFKEDRDMSSAQGIIWIPKVQQTVPYFDKKNPLFETQFDGRRVEGTIIEELPDTTVRIDIAKPLAIRGTTVVVERTKIKEIPRDAPLYTAKLDGQEVTGRVIENLDNGSKMIEFTEGSGKGEVKLYPPTEIEPVRKPGLRWQNYTEALSFMPPETNYGLVYLKNTLLIVILSVIGTLLSSSVVAYAFSRLKFPGRNFIFGVLLSTLMLPAAVTLLPQFLIFKQLGWIDSLLPLWVPAFLGSAFNIFLLRQFFMGIPMELEDAAKMDGCSYVRSFWCVMLPQLKPALAVVAIWTFMGAWNNFIGPLIYVNSPENMPISYALQLFQTDRGLGEPGLLMAFSTLTMLPVLALFFFAQKYFIEGVSLSGLGGR